jgi:hypothetical protein
VECLKAIVESSAGRRGGDIRMGMGWGKQIEVRRGAVSGALKYDTALRRKNLRGMSFRVIRGGRAISVGCTQRLRLFYFQLVGSCTG